MKEKHPVQFGKTLWELIGEATRKHNQKKKTNISPAEYIRKIINRSVRRTLTLSEVQEIVSSIFITKEAKEASQRQRDIIEKQTGNTNS